VIEQLYRKVHGSLDGLEQQLSGLEADATTATKAAPSETPQPAPAGTPQPAATETTQPAATTPPAVTTETPHPSSTATAKSSAVETAAPQTQSQASQPISEESLRSAAARLRTSIKLTGRIVDANKAPLANVTVVLISPSGSVLAATTDSEGN